MLPGAVILHKLLTNQLITEKDDRMKEGRRSMSFSFLLCRMKRVNLFLSQVRNVIGFRQQQFIPFLFVCDEGLLGMESGRQ